MKTIGLIGGTSWHSTLEYYSYINQFTNKRLGAHHSAKIILQSVDFEQFKTMANLSQWGDIATHLISISKNLEYCGVDCIVLCSSTLHKVADQISSQINIPIIHIADTITTYMNDNDLSRPVLFGTLHTMNGTFITQKLNDNNIYAITPDIPEKEIINNIIFSELGKGFINPASKKQLLNIITDFRIQGIDSIILGCTELPLILEEDDIELPLINSTYIHAMEAVKFAIQRIINTQEKT